MSGMTKTWFYTLGAGESITIIASMGIYRLSWLVGESAVATISTDFDLEGYPSDDVTNAAGEGGVISATNFNNPLDGVTIAASGGEVDLMGSVS
jgi:hypothetical protein